MHLEDLLLGAFVYLAAAVVAAPIATRLGLGSVLGYLVAGMVIGPSVLGLVGTEGADVMHFAEFGVIVMLFLVGLELQPSKLWTLRKPIMGLGGLQVTVTGAALALAAYVLGSSWQSSLAMGPDPCHVLHRHCAAEPQRARPAQDGGGAVLLLGPAIPGHRRDPILALLPLIATATAHDDHGTSLIADLPSWARRWRSSRPSHPSSWRAAS